MPLQIIGRSTCNEFMASVAEEWDMLGGLEGIESLRRKMTARKKKEKYRNESQKKDVSKPKHKAKFRGETDPTVRGLMERLDEIGM